MSFDFITNDLLMTFFQLFLAMTLGMLLGIERTLAHKTAGMRTYALVSMGSALFIILSEMVNSSYQGLVNFDPLRLAAAIVTGIGFLGAGLIIFKDQKLSGLTTAAGLWVACGIGMSVGFGFYVLAIFSTLLTFFVFTVLWLIEDKVKHLDHSDGGNE